VANNWISGDRNVPSPEALKTYFDRYLESAVPGMRKPDPAITRYKRQK
jgi:hypothetical protein